jgi:hypothetical protein
MFSNRTIAVIGAFSMIATIATTGHAQPRHHAKDADTDTDPDPDADADTVKPKPRSRAKAKAKAKTKNVDTDADADTDPDTAKPKTKAKTRAKAKVKPRDTDTDSDADADAEADREREKEKEKERARERESERERAREKEAAEAEAAKDKAREKVEETESQATGGSGAGGGEAYQGGTLGFSIPITVVGAATGAAVGEPPPTVDIVYFLDDKAALDLIVGLNVHRRHTISAMAAASDSNLIGVAAGLGYRMYSSKNGLRSFLEPQAVVSWPDISTTDALTVKLGGLMGLERNVTPWFSVSGAIGVTLNFASTFKDIQLATAATLAANLYWR